jgi:hypothetical protein
MVSGCVGRRTGRMDKGIQDGGVVGRSFVTLRQLGCRTWCRFARQFGGGEYVAFGFPNLVYHHLNLGVTRDTKLLLTFPGRNNVIQGIKW